MKTFIFLCAILFAVVSSCGFLEAEISIHRHYALYPQEESVSIYKRGDSSNPILRIAGRNGDAGKDYYYTRCIKRNTEYKVDFYDSENDGWSRGSYIDIAYGNQIILNGVSLSYGSYASSWFLVTYPTWIYFVIGFVGIIILILIIKGLINCCK